MRKVHAKAIADVADDQETPPETHGDDMDEAATVPSWFVRTYEKEDAGDLAERYRGETPRASAVDEQELDAAYESYRRRLEDRFRMAQHMVDLQVAETSDKRDHSPTQRRRIQLSSPSPQFIDPPAFRAQARSRKGILGVSMPMAIVLTALACGAGSAGGYFMANPSALQGVAVQSLALFDGFFAKDDKSAVAANVTSISPKLVKIAEVNVSDVAGSVNAPIPLEISALPPDTQTPINLKISGLPPNSYLTTGVEVKKGEWMLRPDEIPSAQLIVQRSDSPELGLLVTALDAQTGAEAAPAKTMKVALDLNAVPAPGLQPPPNPQTQLKQQVTVTPVSAQPDQGFNKAPDLPQAVPPPKEVLTAESASFLEKGDMLLKTGDIIAARQFYLRAFELNDAGGAYGVARTYDPKVYAELNVRGLAPDPAKAMEWYGKAAAGGNEAASQELLVPPQ